MRWLVLAAPAWAALLAVPASSEAQTWTATDTPTDAGSIVAGPDGSIFQLSGEGGSRPDALVTRFTPHDDRSLTVQVVDEFLPPDGIYLGAIGHDGTSIWYVVGTPTTWEIRKGTPEGDHFIWEQMTVASPDGEPEPKGIAFTGTGVS